MFQQWLLQERSKNQHLGGFLARMVGHLGKQSLYICFGGIIASICRTLMCCGTIVLDININNYAAQRVPMGPYEYIGPVLWVLRVPTGFI